MTLTPPTRRPRAINARAASTPTPMRVDPLVLRRDIFHCHDPADKRPRASHLCVVCVKAISSPALTFEVGKKHTELVYSFQAHEACWKAISDREKRVFDQALRGLLGKGAT